VPSFYFDLAATPGEGAIVELPMGRGNSKRYMYYQMTHGRPLVEGAVSRTPPEAYSSIEETPVLRSLRSCGDHGLPPAGLPSILDDLAEQGIEFVVVHKDLAWEWSVNAWLSARTVAPAYEDGSIAVYNTQADAKGLSGQAQLLESCIAVRATVDGPISAFPGGTLEVPLEWMVGATPGKKHTVELALIDQRGERRQRQRFEVTPGRPVVSWTPGSSYSLAYPLRVSRYLAPGPYRLRATLLPVDRGGEALLSGLLLEVQILPGPGDDGRSLLSGAVNSTFGRSLRILGYGLELRDDELRLDFDWQGLQQMEVPYKFFVHLYEMGSDTIVAQRDWMPHDWTLPTTDWGAAEVVADTILVPLGGVPSGTYRLAVGAYDPATGMRLPVHDSEGKPQPFDRLVLQEWIR
jgi:hypothetical protein